MLWLLLSSTVSFSATLYVNGSTTTCAQGANYTTIQSAINAATVGDTIIVCANGSAGYTENVLLNKSLSLYGNESNVLVVAAIAPSDVFRATSFSFIF